MCILHAGVLVYSCVLLWLEDLARLGQGLGRKLALMCNKVTARIRTRKRLATVAATGNMPMPVPLVSGTGSKSPCPRPTW